MEISNSKNILIGDVTTSGGNIHLGDNLYKSIEYIELEKTITRLEKLVQLTKDEQDKADYYQELEEEKRKLEEFKQGVISLAKTVGNSYMCASGLPTPNPDHAKNAKKASLEIADMVNQELDAKDGLTHFEIRIALHTGPVVAGILGIKNGSMMFGEIQ